VHAALEAVAEEDKAILANLVQLYRHDLSEFRHYPLTEHGTFVYRFLDHYFFDDGRVQRGGTGAQAVDRVVPRYRAAIHRRPWLT
jgi:hypothetical protein